MTELERVTFDPGVMGGKPCIRGMRVTVGTLVGLMASGATREEILANYPYLSKQRILTPRFRMPLGARRKSRSL